MLSNDLLLLYSVKLRVFRQLRRICFAKLILAE